MRNKFCVDYYYLERYYYFSHFRASKCWSQCLNHIFHIVDLLNLPNHPGFRTAEMCNKMKLGCLCDVTLLHSTVQQERKIIEKNVLDNVFLKGSISLYNLIDCKSFILGPIGTFNRMAKTYGCFLTCV